MSGGTLRRCEVREFYMKHEMNEAIDLLHIHLTSEEKMGTCNFLHFLLFTPNANDPWAMGSKMIVKASLAVLVFTALSDVQALSCSNRRAFMDTVSFSTVSAATFTCGPSIASCRQSRTEHRRYQCKII